MKEPLRKWLVLWSFVRQGPRYHGTYLRWRALNFAQRLVRPAYESAASTRVEALLETILNRTEPRFFFDSTDSAHIAAALPERTRLETIAEAERILRGEFAFRESSTVAFEDRIDWNYEPEDGTDWRWDLNRHAYFETLGRAYHYSGDPRYARHIGELAKDWLRNNAPHVDAPNWSSVFEAAYRINSWTWAFFLVAAKHPPEKDVLQTLLRGLLLHGRFVHLNLELHAQNNHLLLEAKALVFLAFLFPEIPEAADWLKRGSHHLYRQVRKQVHNDGVHVELSTHYHRVISGELAELYLLFQINERKFPADVSDRVRLMIEFEQAVLKPDGHIPLLGDSALTDSYARVAAVEVGPWIFDIPVTFATNIGEASRWRLTGLTRDDAKPRRPVRQDSRIFPHGGYCIMRSGNSAANSMYAIADFGGFGYRADPNHGHADALSIELYSHNHSWLIDSGVFNTHAPWPWRAYFRGTRAHNTACVDGEDQTILLDSRRIHRPAQSHLISWHSSDTLDVFAACHDGYRRLVNPLRHCRQLVFVKNGYWLVIDSFTGRGEHDIEVNFHFPPKATTRLSINPLRLSALQADAALSVIAVGTTPFSARVVRGQADPIQGWCSRYSGEKQPCDTLSLFASAHLPVRLCTLLYPHSKDTSETAIELLDGTADAGSFNEHGLPASMAFGVSNDRFSDHLLINAVKPDPALSAFGRFRSDAEIAYIRTRRADGQVIHTHTHNGRLTIDE